MTPELAAASTATFAYLLGSIPFSFWVARAFGVADVRRVGSGNVGATNVLRTAGKAAGLLAFGLDALKGTAASALALWLAPGGWLPALAAVGAVLGHMFPVWLGFRGGKGVATGFGAFVPLAPQAAAAGLAAFAVTLAAFRYVSVASIGGAIALASAAVWLAAPRSVAVAAAGLAALILCKHRENLARLARGDERRLGSR
jgi:glycerol-3-phosphate acyltransferase PlsY